MTAEEALNYLENILAQCSAYLSKEARRKVLDARAIVADNMIKEKPEEGGNEKDTPAPTGG